MSRPIERTLVGLAMLGVVALAGSACASESHSGGPTSTPTDVAEPQDALAADVVGTWGEDTTGTPHLEFTADGQVRGSDGCNGIFTSYAVDGHRIELAQFASTLKACPGVDDWLRGVRAAELDGDVLVVLDGTGARLGELPRAD
jgi:heat shock protein HslJ